MVGRSPYMQAVHLNGPENMLGQLVEVEITAAHANSLAGQLVCQVSGPEPQKISQGARNWAPMEVARRTEKII